MKRSAIAIWKGGPGAGEGSVSTSSGVIANALYSFSSGTGNEPCTNPSEMLAAAVASCMSLMVTRELAAAGLPSESVKTEAILTLEEHEHHWEVAGIQLNVSTQLPARQAENFEHICKAAKSKCPISRALKAPVTITASVQAPQAAAA